MKDAEIRAWLGLPPGARIREPGWRARVLAGMADVPAPDGTAYWQLVIFQAFPGCARPLPSLCRDREAGEEW